MLRMISVQESSAITATMFKNGVTPSLLSYFHHCSRSAR